MGEDTTGGAEGLTYSLLQVSRLQSHTDLAGLEVVHRVKQLARKQHSTALAQLAPRMTAAIRFVSRGGDDPFAKVKGMRESMIANLEKMLKKMQLKKKAYCDEAYQNPTLANIREVVCVCVCVRVCVCPLHTM